MLGVTVLLFLLCFTRNKGNFRITRWKGLLLIGVFVAYQILLFSQL
jgi:cation:H+ antiporter